MMNELCVCILAHNEEKHIAETIRSICSGNEPLNFDIIVYANGCTDTTVDRVKDLSQLMPNVLLREIDTASKPLAWNTAFAENPHPLIIFSDGDVQPEPGMVRYLEKVMKKRTDISLAGCQFWPKRNLPADKRIIGFIQIPLVQDFLAGGFYALRRNDYAKKFLDLGISGMPSGIVADDAFIEGLIPRSNYLTIDRKVYYEPPGFQDYLKYLARIRWQNEQLALLSQSGSTTQDYGVFNKFSGKLSQASGFGRFLLGVTTSSLRFCVRKIFANEINIYYQALGTVTNTGENVLTRATRSQSAK